MSKLATRLLATLAVGVLAACSGGNPTGVSNTPHIGGGPLPLDVLAVTSTDPETGNNKFEAFLRWSPAINAKNYTVYRKFGENPAQEKTTTADTSYTDTSVGRDQTFVYTVRALSGETKELTTSNPTSVTVFPAQVGKPTNLMPADNTVVGVGESPTFKWDAVTGANWYHVKVVNLAADSAVAYSALTQATTIKFGDTSPLTFDRIPNLFTVGATSIIVRGVV
jgi:hypothetical protein